MNQELATRLAADTVRLQRLLPGPIERVWAYLTESDKRGQWLAHGDMELSAGGKVELTFHNSKLSKEPGEPPPEYASHACASTLHGTIVECDPPYVLAHTWGATSQVRFELEERGKEVLLTVTHSKLPNAEQVLSVSGGWHTHVGILIDRLDGREPGNFWKALEKIKGEYVQRYAD